MFFISDDGVVPTTDIAASIVDAPWTLRGLLKRLMLSLDVDLLGYLDRIVGLDPKIANNILNLRRSE